VTDTARLPDPRAFMVMAGDIRRAITDGTIKTGDPTL
jgi:hypothetical protein